MEIIHTIEIPIILFIQSFGLWLKTPMQFFSALGVEYFYMLLIPTLYWCVDSVLGARVGMMLVASNTVYSVLKLAFHTGRPYWDDSRVQAFSHEISFGLPSGHSHSAAAIWGLIAVSLRRRWATWVCAAIIFLISFSRIYLGMHYIGDVLAGWAFGFLVLFLFLRFEGPAIAWFKLRSMPQQILAAFGSSLLIIALPTLVRWAISSWTIPAEWFSMAAAATPGYVIDPLNLNDNYSLAGIWFGILLGITWMKHTHGWFNPQGTTAQRVLRWVIGMIGIVIFWYLLGKVFPRTTDLVGYSLRYLRYLIVGLWGLAGAPMVFFKLGLAKPEK